jgi:hypothetical protein
MVDMSKYKVGDKVLMKMVVDEIRNNYCAPIWVSLEREDTADGMWLKEEQIDKYAYKGATKTYEDGLNDAWELARKICGQLENENNYTIQELKKIFGHSYCGIVMNEHTYQQALAKIEAYEESKAIKVGDVVKTIQAEKQYEFVVTALNGMGVQGIGSKGDIFMLSQKEVEKTGRHIDIEHLLEQIRGNE